MHNAPQRVIQTFMELAAIPRPSRHEQQAAAWVMRWAYNHGMQVRQDGAGNVIVCVAASPGREGAAPVALQAHLDMVCEKEPDSRHDFMTQGVEVEAREGFLQARGTTLGADNGVGVALAMVAAQEPKLSRPALELVFTVDEETGLNGAKALAAGSLQAQALINLDSEEEGVFTVGCAGGMTSLLTRPMDREDEPRPGWICWRLEVGGATGGHSGVDIHLGRASAVKLMGRLLLEAGRRRAVGLQELGGGSADNAIARDAIATVWIDPEHQETFMREVEAETARIREQFAATDPGLRIEAWPLNPPADVRPVALDDSHDLISLLAQLPHGPQAMTPGHPGLVQTSCNVARVELGEHEARVVTSQRSSVEAERDALTERMEAVAAEHGAKARRESAYPGWEPDFDSLLLGLACGTYEDLFGRAPRVSVIHAGLECGLLARTFPGLQMISLGPDIHDPHSPRERVSIASIQRTWTLLAEILQRWE